MGLFDRLFGKKETKSVDEKVDLVKEKKPRQPKKKKEDKVLSEKEKATLAGEPYVNILKMEIDPSDINAGAFELDWNDKFIINLIKAGYRFDDKDTDSQIVDRWFQTVARNIALEVYEQDQADPSNRDLRAVKTKDLGNGRTEVS